jgi:hypothetical protein
MGGAGRPPSQIKEGTAGGAPPGKVKAHHCSAVDAKEEKLPAKGCKM